MDLECPSAVLRESTWKETQCLSRWLSIDRKQRDYIKQSLCRTLGLAGHRAKGPIATTHRQHRFADAVKRYRRCNALLVLCAGCQSITRCCGSGCLLVVCFMRLSLQSFQSLDLLQRRPHSRTLGKLRYRIQLYNRLGRTPRITENRTASMLP